MPSCEPSHFSSDGTETSPAEGPAERRDSAWKTERREAWRGGRVQVTSRLGGRPALTDVLSLDLRFLLRKGKTLDDGQSSRVCKACEFLATLTTARLFRIWEERWAPSAEPQGAASPGLEMTFITSYVQF